MDEQNIKQNNDNHINCKSNKVLRNFLISAAYSKKGGGFNVVSFGIDKQSFYPNKQALELKIEKEILKVECESVTILSVSEMSDMEFRYFYTKIKIG